MLTSEQETQGQHLWNQGNNLGQIAAVLGVGLYDVTPYIVRWYKNQKLETDNDVQP